MFIPNWKISPCWLQVYLLVYLILNYHITLCFLFFFCSLSAASSLLLFLSIFPYYCQGLYNYCIESKFCHWKKSSYLLSIISATISYPCLFFPWTVFQCNFTFFLHGWPGTHRYLLSLPPEFRGVRHVPAHQPILNFLISVLKFMYINSIIWILCGSSCLTLFLSWFVVTNWCFWMVYTENVDKM